jgi:predicted homoserine dehydrogenase-like protein
MLANDGRGHPQCAIPAVEARAPVAESTSEDSDPDVGAQVAYGSIMGKKPIVMLNVETDITVGAYLSDLARRTGALYTVASGDEPGVLKMLHEQALLMGFEVVALGKKGKNNPIDRSATTESCHDEATAKGMNPKMLAAFQDSTKTMVEMAAVSNATGLLPDVPGMHGPTVELPDLVRVFVPVAAVQAVEMARKGGRVVQFGGLAVGESRPGIDLNRIHYQALHLIGATTFAPRHNVKALEWE